VIMLKEHSFNTILESQQCCNELWCAKDVLFFMLFKMTCALPHGRGANWPIDVISTRFSWVWRNLHFDVTSSENDSRVQLLGAVGVGTMRNLSIGEVIPPKLGWRHQHRRSSHSLMKFMCHIIMYRSENYCFALWSTDPSYAPGGQDQIRNLITKLVPVSLAATPLSYP
jgi:hypothetical protein